MGGERTRVLRRLLLLRHAEAAGGKPDLADHDRTLARRGRAAATRIGAYMASRGYVPSQVLCSSSRRTQETFECLVPALGATPELEVLPDLYLASPGTLMSCIKSAPDAATTLLVIAHNPGIAVLASELAVRGEPALRARVGAQFPTAALAVFASDSPGWRTFESELIDFACPRDLPEE